MSVITRNFKDTAYVEGHWGKHYILSMSVTIDDHLRELAKRNDPKHPDWDILLDAKKELEAEHARS